MNRYVLTSKHGRHSDHIPIQTHMSWRGILIGGAVTALIWALVALVFLLTP